ncbi:unnamed protein product, partial [Ectocarpus fasciculatus]
MSSVLFPQGVEGQHRANQLRKGISVALRNREVLRKGLEEIRDSNHPNHQGFAHHLHVMLVGALICTLPNDDDLGWYGELRESTVVTVQDLESCYGLAEQLYKGHTKTAVKLIERVMLLLRRIANDHRNGTDITTKAAKLQERFREAYSKCDGANPELLRFDCGARAGDSSMGSSDATGLT